MSFKTGYIYHFKPCRTSYPVKNKYAICMSGECGWFFLINSCDDKRPYDYEKDLSVIFNEFQVEPLKHKSYINVNKLKTIGIDDYDECQEYKKVSNMIWLKIRGLCLQKLPKRITDVIYGDK